MDRREFLKSAAMVAAGVAMGPGELTDMESKSFRLSGPDVTEIVLVLDKSGSMGLVRDATIASFNDFIEEQQAEPGKAAFTLTLFDTHYSVVLNGVDIGVVKGLDSETYRPGGGTALYDAVGRTIYEVDERLRKIPEHRRPKKVIFVVLTDGEENSSQEYTLDMVMGQVTESRAKGWKFVYLGANQDAWEVARRMGVPVAGAASFVASRVGTGVAFAAASGQTISYRRAADPTGWDPSLSDSSIVRKNEEDKVS